VKETVSVEVHEDQWGVRSIDKVQHTAKERVIFIEERVGGRARVD